MKLVIYTNKGSIALSCERTAHDRWTYTTRSGRKGIQSTRAMSVLIDSAMLLEDNNERASSVPAAAST